MKATAPLSDERQVAGVIAAALRLAGATLFTTADGVHEATVPAVARQYFGNRSHLRYALDRGVRQFHADVEYATVGSALVTQAIQYIRENTSIVHARNVVNGAKAEDLVRALVDPSLTLREVRPELLAPDYVARAQVVVTMVSDDRRSFLYEVFAPLGVPPDRAIAATTLAANVVNTGQAHQDFPHSVRDTVTRVLEAAEIDLKTTIAEREAELEAQLQEASRRLAPQALEALRKDLALSVELDVAYLEFARLGRVRYHATVLEPAANIQHSFALEAYEGQSVQVACPVCRGLTSRLDLCAEGGVHLSCPACAVRCSVCSGRRCRQHPVGSCVDPNCYDGFCSACTKPCSQCGGRACAQHLTVCDGWCGGSTCTTCRSECAFEPGIGYHSSHLESCRECGRAACARHSARCGEEGPGGPLLCLDHLSTCAIDAHSLVVCAAHSGTCAACGRVGCAKHQKACADCGRAACVDDAQPCAVGGEWLLNIHAKRCADCGDNVCANHSGTCAICSKSTCSRHLAPCSVGGEVVCRVDRTRCPECGDSCCDTHLVRCGVGGGHPVCGRDRCTSSCAEDGAPVCHTHEVVCERGREAICPPHVLRCDDGGEKLCSAHAISCEVGAERHCEVHKTECGVCGRSTCGRCAAVRLTDGAVVCDACTHASAAPTGREGTQRPLVDRVLVRRPLVARSRTLVSVTSISRLRAEVRTFDADGRLVESRKLEPRRARAYQKLVQSGASAQLPGPRE
jgi:hypothetical protein